LYWLLFHSTAQKGLLVKEVFPAVFSKDIPQMFSISLLFIFCTALLLLCNDFAKTKYLSSVSPLEWRRYEGMFTLLIILYKAASMVHTNNA
jgi:hypothetical protein